MKLTLNVKPAVITSAKRYAKRKNVSVSSIVESYLSVVGEPAAPPTPREDLPVLQALRGILKNGDTEGYKKHLMKKYR